MSSQNNLKYVSAIHNIRKIVEIGRTLKGYVNTVLVPSYQSRLPRNNYDIPMGFEEEGDFPLPQKPNCFLTYTCDKGRY
jgi:hypothetical protein